MSDYDLLYGVVLRLDGGNGVELSENIDEISKRLGALPYCDVIIISKRVLHRREVQTKLERWVL